MTPKDQHPGDPRICRLGRGKYRRQKHVGPICPLVRLTFTPCSKRYSSTILYLPYFSGLCEVINDTVHHTYSAMRHVLLTLPTIKAQRPSRSDKIHASRVISELLSSHNSPPCYMMKNDTMPIYSSISIAASSFSNGPESKFSLGRDQNFTLFEEHFNSPVPMESNNSLARQLSHQDTEQLREFISTSSCTAKAQ